MQDSRAQKILQFYESRRRMPTYTEIMKLVGFKSKNAVAKLIDKMIDAGLVEKDSRGHLIPRQIFGEVKMLGVVEAGIPAFAEEAILDTISFDEFLIRDRESTYVLTVKGDSMIDAGICEGDLVVAERAKTPKDGDIVIADVDGGWTMKYLRSKGGKQYLEPANKNFKNIYPEESMQIAAVVKAVIRKYR